jgi:glycosyltransferase involved in cell wall biosynthesis
VNSLPYLDDNIRVLFAGYYPTDQPKGIRKKIKNFLPMNRRLLRSLANMRNSKNAIEVGIQKNIKEILDESTILVFPSVVPHFARPVIEAMIRKRPVIASKIDGIEELIEDGETGILFNSNDHLALAKAINDLSCNLDYAAELADKAYNFSTEYFLPANNSKIEELLSEHFTN